MLGKKNSTTLSKGKKVYSKTLSEDELKQAEGDLQTLTDKYIKQIDESVAQKEREVMEV